MANTEAEQQSLVNELIWLRANPKFRLSNTPSSLTKMNNDFELVKAIEDLLTRFHSRENISRGVQATIETILPELKGHNRSKTNSLLTFAAAIAISLLILTIAIGTWRFNLFGTVAQILPTDTPPVIGLVETQTPTAKASSNQLPTNTKVVFPTSTATLHPATATSTLTTSPSLNAMQMPTAGAIRFDIHGIEQVWVPKGCFWMGSILERDSIANDNEKPYHEVCLTSGFWMDKYEVTNQSYQQFIDAGGYTTQTYWSDEGWKWLLSQGRTAPQDYPNSTAPKQPRVGISWYEAEAYAKWRNGRLPTEAQWEYAARGSDSTIYPWGNAWNANYAAVTGNTNTSKDVGSYPDGRSWCGVYDMAGNVSEWVADWYSVDYYRAKLKNDPMGPSKPTDSRITRGGSWSQNKEMLRSAARLGFKPGYINPSLGFRIVTNL